MKYAGYISLVVAFLFLAAAVGYVQWLFHQNNNLTFVYTWRVEFGTTPTDDNVLTDWLKSQSGVTQASIAREGKTLVIIYEAKVVKELPDVLGKAEALGYANRGNFFSDMRKR